MENKYIGGDRGLNHSGLAIGSSTEKVSTTAKNGSGFSEYMIDGKSYFLADGDHALTAETLATAYTAILLIMVNAAGTVSSKLGTAVLTADITNGVTEIPFPLQTANTAVLGYVKIANATGSNFVVGTTGLDTANITDTYQACCQVPSAPLTS